MVWCPLCAKRSAKSGSVFSMNSFLDAASTPDGFRIAVWTPMVSIMFFTTRVLRGGRDVRGAKSLRRTKPPSLSLM
jgi:hypothetical protein